MTWEILLQILASTARMSIPLLFAAMAGIIAERSGVINIALEGFILFGAFFAALVTLSSGSPWVGLVAAMLAGSLVATLYAILVVWLRADQIVAGTAINLLAFGSTPLIGKIAFGSGGSSPAIELADRFQYEPIILGILLVVIVHLWLHRTTSGLWLQFAGEHPEALECAGVKVRRLRTIAVIVSGATAAAGGALLSIWLSSSFARGMSAGRGFMALAAVVFGRWMPIPTALACLLFGFTDALQMRLQGATLPGMTEPLPVQVIQVLPYLATIVVLAAFVGRAYAPRALGRPA